MHITKIRVYYEDTDAGAVVYYANYLKFVERARTEFFRELGVNQSSLAKEKNMLFVVRRAEIDLKKPAILDDLLIVETNITKISKASFQMLQEVKRDGEILAVINVKIACVSNGENGLKPVALPSLECFSPATSK